MEISRDDFERSIMLVYKRGRVMEKELYISDIDVQKAINDIYELLGIDHTSQPAIEADEDCDVVNAEPGDCIHCDNIGCAGL